MQKLNKDIMQKSIQLMGTVWSCEETSNHKWFTAEITTELMEIIEKIVKDITENDVRVDRLYTLSGGSHYAQKFSCKFEDHRIADISLRYRKLESYKYRPENECDVDIVVPATGCCVVDSPPAPPPPDGIENEKLDNFECRMFVNKFKLSFGWESKPNVPLRLGGSYTSGAFDLDFLRQAFKGVKHNLMPEPIEIESPEPSEPVLQSIEEWTGHRKTKNSFIHSLTRSYRKFHLAKAIKRRMKQATHRVFMDSIIPDPKPSNKPVYNKCTELVPLQTYDFLNPILFLVENFRCDDEVYEIQERIKDVDYALVRPSKLAKSCFASLRQISKLNTNKHQSDLSAVWILNMLSRADVIGVYLSDTGTHELNTYSLVLLLMCIKTKTKIVIGCSENFSLYSYIKGICQNAGIPVVTNLTTFKENIAENLK